MGAWQAGRKAGGRSTPRRRSCCLGYDHHMSIRDWKWRRKEGRRNEVVWTAVPFQEEKKTEGEDASERERGI